MENCSNKMSDQGDEGSCSDLIKAGQGDQMARLMNERDFFLTLRIREGL